MSKSRKQKSLSESAAAIAAAGPYPFELWRLIPAEEFDKHRKYAVGAYLATCAAGDVEWRRAIAGDETCAVRIALRMQVPDDISYPVDARMTLLVYAALNGGAAAALTLANLLRRMPLDAQDKNVLANSWLARNARMAAQDASELRRRLLGEMYHDNGL
ncbi:hypothetical protein [Mesorhizobium sp.]|uniref:hypothetical protein n=1 Tax=Mesorhizobium sp. TaxID=1871066 RepID=UPI0025EECFCE|nr:hypothetical protein [Mesorhizobium sp.]